MTSDFVQQGRTPGRTRHAPLLIRKIEKSVAGSPRSKAALEKDGLRRSISATIALLKRAQNIIERAEQKIALQSERIRVLEELKAVDELTGLHNRRGFCLVFAREIARTQRGLNDGGLLVLVEMDNMASVASTYGHDTADSCLKLIARIIEGETRAMDISARINPGEFVLLFSNTASDVALERAQKLASRLNNLSLIRRGREIQISTSISLNAYGPEDKAEALLPAEIKQEIANDASPS